MDKRGKFTGKHALVVDDIQFNRVIFVRMLQNLGFAVEEAGGGSEALDLYDSRKGGYALILVDVVMPSMDGYELTRAIRNRTDGKQAKIVIISAAATADHSKIRKTALSNGADDFLVKPIDRRKLSTVVGKLCKES